MSTLKYKAAKYFVENDEKFFYASIILSLVPLIMSIYLLSMTAVIIFTLIGIAVYISINVYIDNNLQFKILDWAKGGIITEMHNDYMEDLNTKTFIELCKNRK